jgi:hypothetical protein
MGFAVFSPTLKMIVCFPLTASRNLVVSTDGGRTWQTFTDLLPIATAFSCAIWVDRFQIFCFMTLGTMVPLFYMWNGQNDPFQVRFNTIVIDSFVPGPSGHVTAMGYTPKLGEFWFCGSEADDPSAFSNPLLHPLI